MERIFKPLCVVVLALLLITTGAFAKRKKKDKQAEEDVWVTIPEDSLAQESKGYVLTTLEGTEMTNLDLLGKPVVLDIFGVACGPCRNALIFTQKLHDEYGKDVFIYAVDAWNDTPEQIEGLWAELVLDIEVLVCDDAFLDKFQIDAVPTYCVFDQEGELIEKLVGYSEDNEKALEKRISKLIKKNGDTDIALDEGIEDRGEPQIAAAVTGEDSVVHDTPVEEAVSPGEEVVVEEEVLVEEEVIIEEETQVVEAAVTPPMEGATEAEVSDVQPPVNIEVIIHNYPTSGATPSGQASPVVISSQPPKDYVQSAGSAGPIVISAGSGTPTPSAPIVISGSGAYASPQTVPVIISPAGGMGTYSYSTGSQPPMGTVPVVISPGGSYGAGYSGGYGSYGTYGYTVQPPRGILYFHNDTSGVPYGSVSGIYQGYTYTPQGHMQQPRALLYFHTDESSQNSSNPAGYQTQTYTPDYGSYGQSNPSSTLTFHDATTTHPTWFVVSFEPQSAALDYTDMAVIRAAASEIKASSGSSAQLVSYSTISSLADSRLQAVAGALMSAGVSANQLRIYNTSGYSSGHGTLRSVEIFVQGGVTVSESGSQDGVKPATSK